MIYLGGQPYVSPRNIGLANSGDVTYDDLQVNVSIAKLPAVNAPTWEDITLGSTTFKLLAFDTDDYIDISVQTNHSVDIASIIKNHIHWTIATDDVGDEFRFEVSGVAAGINSTFADITTITSADVVLAAGDAKKHKILDIGNMSNYNTTVSSAFILRLKRIAPATGNDTTEKIYVIFNDCHVMLDTFGSLNETSKT